MYTEIVFFVLYGLQASVFIFRDQHLIAISIARCCVSLTVPISLYHCYEHLSCFTRPRLQSQIVRIIMMVPVYSVEGMLSISFPSVAFYLQALRETYEAFVIYSFMRYLLNFLTDLHPNLPHLLGEKPASIGVHKYPFCLLYPWQMGVEFLANCKAGVFQYVIVRVFLTVASVPSYALGWYVEGQYHIASLYTWIVAINCVSQMFALYSLFLFYHAAHEELYILRPFAKFICIKVVVFFSWFQGVAIGVLVQLGHISEMSANGDDDNGHSVQEVADGIQDLLICMEMFLAAIAFYNSFPISEFSPGSLENDSTMRRQRGSLSSAGSPRFHNEEARIYITEGVTDNPSLESLRHYDPGDLETGTPIFVRTEEEDEALFPAVNRKLNLRDRMDNVEGRRGSYPIVSFWGNILQLLGGGETTKLKSDETFSDEEFLSEDENSDTSLILEKRIRNPFKYKYVSAAKRKELILTPDIIRNDCGSSFKTIATRQSPERRVVASLNLDQISQSPPPQDGGRISSFQSPIPDSSSAMRVSSQYRWRSGRDPLHQRLGDSVTRSSNNNINTTLAPRAPDNAAIVRQKSGSGGDTYCSRFTCGLSGYISVGSIRSNFGNYELESLWSSCLYYWKWTVSFFARHCTRCYVDGTSIFAMSHEMYSPNYRSNMYGIHNTSMVLPALWTVLIPVELLQDFSDFWMQVVELFRGILRTVSKRCGSKEGGSRSSAN